MTPRRWMLVTREERAIVEYHRRRARRIESLKKLRRERKTLQPAAGRVDALLRKNGLQ